MPCHWLPPSGDMVELHLWPHRSLPRRGFVAFIGVTAALALLPMLTVLGSPVVWFVLPFAGAALAAIWFALQRNTREGEVLEVLRITPTDLRLTRHGPRTRQEWSANRHWVQITLHETGGPVPNYLTLKGNGREVELGAFLREEERISLSRELLKRIRMSS